MVASVAVISDIHGVLPVLDAVLAEPDVQAADLSVVTGDHAAGPQPVAVLDRLVSLGDRALLVRGNADGDLIGLAHGEDVVVPDQIVPWAAQRLTPGQVDLLAGLPHPVVFDVDGFGPVVFCHGSPRRDDEVVLVDTGLERWLEVFADLLPQQQTVVCGHTHMPFDRHWSSTPEAPLCPKAGPAETGHYRETAKSRCVTSPSISRPPLPPLPPIRPAPTGNSGPGTMCVLRRAMLTPLLYSRPRRPRPRRPRRLGRAIQSQTRPFRARWTGRPW